MTPAARGVQRELAALAPSPCPTLGESPTVCDLGVMSSDVLERIPTVAGIYSAARTMQQGRMLIAQRHAQASSDRWSESSKRVGAEKRGINV